MMNDTVKIALYQGISIESKVIRWQTRSIYSHVVAILPDGSVIEAWHKGGVSHIQPKTDGFKVNILLSCLSKNHTPCTKVDIFEIEIPENMEQRYYSFLEKRIGCKYDFYSIFRFLSRKSGQENDKWFCSELIFAALVYAHSPPLSRINSCDVSPQLLSLSNDLKFVQQVITI